MARFGKRGSAPAEGAEAGGVASSTDYGKTASFLAVGVGLTGVITYAYFLIASHTLSKPDYGQITVLWSAVFITISTLYRPIEQLLSRHISERRVKGEPLGQPMRVAATIQLGLSLLFTVLARAPLQLFQSVSTSILPHLSTLHHRDEAGAEREFQRTVRMVLLGIAAFTLLVVACILVAGPQLMQLAFSNTFTYDRIDLLPVGIGMGLYLASVTVNQACIAQGQVRRAALRWFACASIFVAWNFVPLVSNEFRRVEIGFLVAAGVLFALLYLVYRRPRARAEDVPEPGSGEELEVQVGMLDENV